VQTSDHVVNEKAASHCESPNGFRADLRDADLRDADLRDADLRDANLCGANLRGFDLSGKDLSGLNFVEADLSGANCTRANFANANLHGAKLVDTEFFLADLTGADLSMCDATASGFGQATMTGARLFGGVFDRAVFAGAKLRNADLCTASLDGARLRGADLRDTDAMGCVLTNCDLVDANVEGAVLDNAVLQGARLTGVKCFEDASWIGCDISEANFRGAYTLRRFVRDQNYLAEFRARGGGRKLLYWIWWATSNCGRSALRWALFTLMIAGVFAAIYTQAQVDFGARPTPISPLYFSVVTLTTLGFGDVVPVSVFAQVVVIVQVFIGYILLGGLLSIFANQMARRAD